MKISFIIGTMTSGGAERVISVLANEMVKNGYNVSIIMFRPSPTETYKLDPRIKCTVLDDTKKRIVRLMRLPFRLIKEMRTEKADVFVSFCILENVVSCFAKLFTKCKLVISERNAPKNEKIGYIYRFLRKVLYRFADGIVFQTDEAKNSYPLTLSKRGVVIANPVKDDLPEKNEYKSTGRISAIGRLCEQKNYPLLLEAFAEIHGKYPDYSLDIYGHGELENTIKQIIEDKELEKWVNLQGFRSDVHSQIIDSDIYVLSSDYEGMPNSLMEAMAIGIPVVSTNCPSGGPKELIKDGENGLLVRVNDKYSLVKALDRLLGSYELRMKIGNNAKNIRIKYAKETITKKWEEYLMKLISNNGNV